MTIKVRFMGQLGNQMYQYCIGRIISERTGQRYLPTSTWLNKRGQHVIWSDTPLFVPEKVNGNRASGEPQHISVDHWLDLDSIDPSRPVFVNHGYFQRYELYRPYKEQIRNDWLRIRRPWMDCDPDAVYLHVRRADYVPFVDNPNNPTRHCLAASLDEYRECLNHFPDAKRMVIVTDDPRDPFHQELATLGLPCEISGLSWDQDFLLLASCRWLIMCQSTFSWWAGFLGRAERIVCPVRPGTFWHYGVGLYGPAAPDYPNLYVDDEPERWIWTP